MTRLVERLNRACLEAQGAAGSNKLYTLDITNLKGQQEKVLWIADKAWDESDVVEAARRKLNAKSVKIAQTYDVPAASMAAAGGARQAVAAGECLVEDMTDDVVKTMAKKYGASKALVASGSDVKIVECEKSGM